MELYVTLLYISKFPVNVLPYFHNLKNKKETEKKVSPRNMGEDKDTKNWKEKKKCVWNDCLDQVFFKCLESITHSLLWRCLWNHNNKVELSTGTVSMTTSAKEDVQLGRVANTEHRTVKSGVDHHVTFSDLFNVLSFSAQEL